MTASLLWEQQVGTEGERRAAVLRHVKRYKITLVHAVKRLFFPPHVEPDHKKAYAAALALLNSLAEEGRLERLKGRSEFARNVFISPGHMLKEDADLSRIWFCLMNRERRHLTQHDEVTPVFDAEYADPPYHNYAHAIADAPGGPVLLRLYLCAAEKKHARQQLVDHISKKAKSFRNWVDSGSYGVAVLVQSEQKRKEIDSLISRSHGGKPPLREQARFVVETVPTVQSFPQAIKKHEAELWR